MKAVIYARFSSDLQREESIDAQVRACSEYAKNQGWVVVDTYIDRAVSARSDQRPEFQKMIADSKLRKFDYIVIHKLDRFSRDRYDHAFYKRELKIAGVRLISVLENLDDSPESVVLESILEGFSEYYSRNLSREVMKGLKENALQCRHTGGVPPLGYDVVDGRYVVNEKEAVAIRFIFDSYINDLGYDKIALWLKENGIRGKRGSTIAKNSLHDILCNEKYTGVFIYNRSSSKDVFGKRNGHRNKDPDKIIRVEGGMPAIISAETYRKAMSKMNKNKSGRHRASEPYILAGLIFCGDCGAAMVGSSRGNPRTATEVPKKYYLCNRKARTSECSNKGVNRDVIEGQVLSYLERLDTREAVDGMGAWIADNAKIYRKNSQSELRLLKKELSGVEKDIQKLLDKILDGLDSGAARERLADLESKKLRVEVRITDLQVVAENAEGVSKAGIKKYLSQLSKIHTLAREQQVLLVRQFIDQVLVYPPEDGDGEREFLIKTKLDILIGINTTGFSGGCEDRKGVAPTPPLLSSRLPWWIQEKTTL